MVATCIERTPPPFLPYPRPDSPRSSPLPLLNNIEQRVFFQHHSRECAAQDLNFTVIAVSREQRREVECPPSASRHFISSFLLVRCAIRVFVRGRAIQRYGSPRVKMWIALTSASEMVVINNRPKTLASERAKDDSKLWNPVEVEDLIDEVGGR